MVKYTFKPQHQNVYSPYRSLYITCDINKENLLQITSFTSLWSFLWFSWRLCFVQQWYCLEKLAARRISLVSTKFIHIYIYNIYIYIYIFFFFSTGKCKSKAQSEFKIIFLIFVHLVEGRCACIGLVFPVVTIYIEW